MADYCRVYGVNYFTSPAGWLPVHRDQLRAQCSVTSMGKLYLFFTANLQRQRRPCEVWIVQRDQIVGACYESTDLRNKSAITKFSLTLLHSLVPCYDDNFWSTAMPLNQIFNRLSLFLCDMCNLQEKIRVIIKRSLRFSGACSHHQVACSTALE